MKYLRFKICEVVTSERETIAWSVGSVDITSGTADPEVQLTRLRDLEVLRDVTWVEAAECLNTWNSMGVWQVLANLKGILA